MRTSAHILRGGTRRRPARLFLLARTVSVAATAALLTSCDQLPGNDKDKWRFHQEIRIQGGTTGGSQSPVSSSDYQIHENGYYGGSASSGVSDYRSNYKPYEPYKGYEVGSSKQYYRGDSDD